MRLDWILSPLAQYATAAASLVASLVLFLALKFELNALRRAAQSTREELDGRFRETEAGLAQLREQMAESALKNPAPGGPLNLTRRTQAIRMHQRGEPIETIAGALRAPRNEIQLLIKLQELSGRPRDAGEAAQG
jgi:hypothetical protein